MPQKSRNREPVKKHSLKFWIAVVTVVLVSAALLFLASPFFSVREVIITGDDRVSQADIRARLGVNNATNLLFLNTGNARSRIMENLFIGDVFFQKDLPGRLYVHVHERRLSAYVEHMPGRYLFLDDMGRVLDERSYRIEPLPVLEGFHFTRFQIGEILEVPDDASFAVVVRYAQLLNHHGLIGRVSSMNVSDPENVRINIYNIEFNVGGLHRADEKVSTIVEIIDVLPNAEVIRAFGDLREIRPEFFFEILQ